MPDTDPLTALTQPATSLDSLIAKHSERTGLDPELVRRLVSQESRGHSNAVSPKGAGGTMQLMPATAANLGVKNRFDPDENIRGGTDYLKQQLDKFGDVNLALAAYNAGPGAVQKYGNKVPPYKETQDYVKKIGGGYQGTGYAQDPLTALTKQVPTSPDKSGQDPLAELTQQPVAATAFKELNQQPRTRPKKSILSSATGGMGGSQQGNAVPSYLSAVAPSIAQQLPAQRKLADAHFQQLKNQQDLAAQGGQMSMTSRKNDDELRSQAEDLANKELVDRPKIDALKDKFSSVAGKNTHVGRAVNSVWNALAGTNVQVGNVIQGVTGGRRGGGVVEDARLAQQALAELDQEDPDKGWLAAGEKVLPGAAIEAGKMTMGQRVLGAATLPALGAASEADKGIIPAATAAGEGYLYHKGLGLTESMGPAGRFITGTSVPAVVSIARGEDPKTALLSNTAYGAMALAGGRPKEGEVPREAVQTVPEPLQAKLRGAEIGKTIDESIAAKEAKVQPTFLRDDAGNPVARVLNPEEVAQGAKPKIRPIHQADTQVRDEVGKFAATEAPTEQPTEQPNQPVPQSTPEVQPTAAVSPSQPLEAVESQSPAANSPETKPSRLAQGVEAKAVAANLTQGFADLPEYQTVKVADQAERAVKLLNDDPDLAKRIAVGTEQPPHGLLPESVFTAVENRALQQGDIQTIQDLAQGSRSVEASGMGQRLRLLAERNPNSAVSAIQQIEKARSASVPKEKLAQTAKQIQTEVSVEMKQSAPKAGAWAKFLDEVMCR